MTRFILLFLLLGCSPHTAEEFQGEGEARMKQLTMDLQKIQHRQDVAKALPQMKKHFQGLVDLVIAARKSQVEQELPLNRCLNEALQKELQRVSLLEGGSEMIKAAQKEAILRLDAFEHSMRRE